MIAFKFYSTHIWAIYNMSMHKSYIDLFKYKIDVFSKYIKYVQIGLVESHRKKLR